MLQRLQDIGATLNIDIDIDIECEFFQTSATFVEHKITSAGIRADDDKVKAIRDMPRSCNITELRQFLGMVNQLGKFSSQLPEKTYSFEYIAKEIDRMALGSRSKPRFQGH